MSRHMEGKLTICDIESNHNITWLEMIENIDISIKLDVKIENDALLETKGKRMINQEKNDVSIMFLWFSNSSKTTLTEITGPCVSFKVISKRLSKSYKRNKT